MFHTEKSSTAFEEKNSTKPSVVDVTASFKTMANFNSSKVREQKNANGNSTENSIIQTPTLEHAETTLPNLTLGPYFTNNYMQPKLIGMLFSFSIFEAVTN